MAHDPPRRETSLTHHISCRNRKLLLFGVVVCVVSICGVTILTQASSMATLLFRGGTLSSAAGLSLPLLSKVDLESLDQRVAECRMIEPVLPTKALVRCETLAPSYGEHDLIDLVSIMSKRSVLELIKDRKYNMYLHDLSAMLAILPPQYWLKPFAIRLGDLPSDFPFPILAKARQVGQQSVTIIPFNHDRHFSRHFLKLLHQGDPIKYEDKIPVAFWRGTTTGWNWDPREPTVIARRHLVEKWGMHTHTHANTSSSKNNSLVDVGLSFLAQEALKYPDTYQPYIKPQMGIESQLRYRYLIAVEGNDVSTGLKWMLASNSVVLMPPPTMESFLHEGRLAPWVHYVPLLPDTSDLEDKILLCEREPSRCRPIAQRATEFVKVYSSKEQILIQGAKQLGLYMQAVDIQFQERAQANSSRPLVHCEVMTA